jgi:hypothetical protein
VTKILDTVLYCTVLYCTVLYCRNKPAICCLPDERTHNNSCSSFSLDDASDFPVIEVASEEIMMDLFAETKRIKLSCPISLKDERAKKEWIWEHRKETLMKAMILSCDEKENNQEIIRVQQPQGEKAHEEKAPEGEEQLQGQEEA